MGLKLKKTFKNQGVVAPDCYVNIERAIYLKEHTLLKVYYYFNEEARDNNLEPLFVGDILIDKVVDGKDKKKLKETREDFYKDLKKTDEFKDAQDIFEDPLAVVEKEIINDEIINEQ